MFTTFVVEDEPLSRRRLVELLRGHADIQLIGQADSGSLALTTITALRPQLLFLDIELPDFSGLDLLRRLPYRPLVIFTTAFDKYAVTAFELAAADYLLKPFGPERLAHAIARLRRDQVIEEPNEPLEARASTSLADRDALLTRFFVRDRGKLVPINTADVERLEADDDYVRVYVGGRVHLVYLRLNDFERRLEPDRFVRIHRGHIVNLSFVKHMVPADDGRFVVEMHDGHRITASRARARQLRQLTL